MGYVGQDQQGCGFYSGFFQDHNNNTFSPLVDPFALMTIEVVVVVVKAALVLVLVLWRLSVYVFLLL